MLIKKIELKNFRQYIDTTIEFSTDPDKNITLIMGDNGTGKTTLAQAFQWALYGDTSFQIKELINRKVREKMSIDGAGNTKTVSVTLTINYNDTEYCIRRLVTYKKETMSKVSQFGDAKFTISFMNNKGVLEYLPDYKKAQFIRRILPQDLSKFFFFDGEKIEEMSKNIQKGKGEEFKEAVYSLVGLAAIQSAIEHLHSKTYSKKSVIKVLKEEKEANNKSRVALDQYNAEIERIEGELEEKIKKKDALAISIEDIEGEIEVLQRIILSETPKMKLKEEYETLVNDLRELYKKKNSCISTECLKEIKRGLFGFCMAPIADNDNIKELLEASAPEKKMIPGLTKKTIEHLLERGTCLCGTCLQEKTVPYQLVEELLEYSYPKTVGMLKEDYLKSKKLVEKESKDYLKNITNSMRNLSDINAQIEGKELEHADKMNQLANTEKGEEAKKQKKSSEIKRKNLINEQIQVIADIKFLEQRKQRQITEKEKLIIVNDDTLKAQKYLDYAEEIYARMKKEYTEKENTYRLKLEKEMNQIFETIYDGNININIDARYKITVHIDENLDSRDEVERNTAQSYALIFAFIAAIIDLAKKKVNEDAIFTTDKINVEKEGYPLIMDAPLSAFDITRIKSICTEIPRIADQVIMFIKDTDGNIAEQYMHDKIGKRYTAQKINGSNLESQILEEM